MIKNIILTLQIILSLFLIFLIVIQAKGTGLGSSFGSGLSLYSTKRGVEKVILYLTIGFSVLFFLSSIALLIVK